MFRRRNLLALIAIPTVAVLLWAEVAGAQPPQRGQGRGGPGRQGFGGFRPGGPGGFRGGFGGGFGGLDRRTLLTRFDQVQKELKVTEAQKEQIEKLSEADREQMRELFSSLRDLNEEDREKRFAELRKRGEEFEKKLLAILKPDQAQRLNEIFVQVRGVRALLDEQVAKELELTQGQKDKIAKAFEPGERPDFSALRDLSDEERRQRFEQMRERMEAERKKSEEQAVAVLNEVQKELWQLMQGEEFELDMRAGFGRFGGRRGPGGPGDEGRPRRPGRPGGGDQPDGQDRPRRPE